MQGEALELELERSLRERFPRDVMKPVTTGQVGADLLHTVVNQAGRSCGLIIWEAKRTKIWNGRWLAKLRDDQRTANAGIALIVSAAMPKTVETFDLIGGVWITKPRYAIPLAIALRQSIIVSAESNFAAEDQRTKTGLVYQYLTGPRFRHRIEAIVEKFEEMQIDLDRERKAMTRLWAKRDEQLKGVLNSSAGLYGDLQGIAGQDVPELERLKLWTAAGLVDKIPASCRGAFERLGTDAAQMAVTAGSVVEHLNVIEDVGSGQISGFVDAFADTFLF